MLIYLTCVAVFSWPWLIASVVFSHSFAQTLVFNGLAMLSVAAVTAILFRKNDGLKGAGWRAGKRNDYLLAFAIALMIFGPALITNQYGFYISKGGGEFLHACLVTLGLLLIYPVFGFGEELGWRGYLLPKLFPLGPRKAVVLLGIIWGVWHWPFLIGTILHNKSMVDDSNLLVILPVTLFGNLFLTIALSAIFAWFWGRSRSIFAVAFLHGAFDWVRDASAFFPSDAPKFLLIGPQVAMVALGYYLLWRGRFQLAEPTPEN